MKVVPILILLYVALMGIIIFDGLDTSDPFNIIPYANSTGNLTTNETAIWSFFVDPTSWRSSTFITILIGVGAIAAISTVAAWATKSDIALLISVFILIINAGVIPIIAIWQVIHRELWAMFCSGTLSPTIELSQEACQGDPYTTATIFTALIVGPIALAWVFACVEWWTQRPTS